MSQDFTAPNKSLESAIAAAQSPQQVAEVLRLHQEKSGTPQWDNRYEMPPASVAAPMPAVAPPSEPARQNCVRYLYFGNSRFELWASSEGELDAQEQKIRSLYGK